MLRIDEWKYFMKLLQTNLHFNNIFGLSILQKTHSFNLGPIYANTVMLYVHGGQLRMQKLY